MFNIKVTGVTFKFDAAGLNKKSRELIERNTKFAVREFAKEALFRIPIRTGFVSGAFGVLTDLVGKTAGLSPKVAFQQRLTKAKLSKRKLLNTKPRGQEFYKGTLKTPTSGRLFATKPEDVLKWEGDVYVFTFNVDINYFRINDAVAGHAPTAPWKAFVAAEVAFEKYMKKWNQEVTIKLEDYLQF